MKLEEIEKELSLMFEQQKELMAALNLQGV